MPELTIVVPLLHDIEAFEATLASVLRFSHQDVQIIGLHDGHYEDQYGIGEEVELIPVSTPFRPGQGKNAFGMMALALEDIRAPWIHWISPGIEPLGECYDKVFQRITASNDLGLISPQVLPADGSDETGTDDLECLASAVVCSSGFHPQYLEEVVGDCWTIEDLDEKIQLTGPTSWSGFCRKNLLQQWSQNHPKELRFQDGYRELAFGLFLQQEGWTHEIIPCSLIASESTEEAIRQSWTRNGRLAIDLMSRYHPGSAVSKVIGNLVAGGKEICQSILSPNNFAAAIGRIFGTPALIGGKSKSRRSVPRDLDLDRELTFEIDSKRSSGQNSDRMAA